MYFSKRILGILILVLLFVWFGGCPSPVPQEELNQAKAKIEEAERELAPTYANQDFSVALTNYAEATNLVNQGKNDEAKKKALITITNADVAIQKSLKARSEESINKLDTLLNKASLELKAEVLDPETFTEIKNGLDQSSQLHKEEKYRDSISNSRSYISLAESMIAKLEERWNNAKTELNKSITLYERIKKLKVSIKFESELNEVNLILEEARALLSEAKLDETIQKSQEAWKRMEELLPSKSQKYLEETGNKLKELKLNMEFNPELKFVYLSSKKEITSKKKAEILLAKTYQKVNVIIAQADTSQSEPIQSQESTQDNTQSQDITPEKETNQLTDQSSSEVEQKQEPEEEIIEFGELDSKDISEMTLDELKEYNQKLNLSIDRLKTKIKKMYDQAKTEYEEKKYEQSIETLDKVNQLIAEYEFRSGRLTLVEKEMKDRESKQVVSKPVVIEPTTVTEKTYKVKPGDYLSKIASDIYNGQYWWWPRIFTANKEKITDPDTIEVDQELVIPNLPE